jgi:hypothetical protein
MRTRFLHIILFFFVAGLMFSCSVERNLARRYVKGHKGDGVLLSPVNFLYKDYLGAYIDTDKYPKPEQQDSVAYYQSNYVQYILDSVFLTNFTNSLIEGLEDYGFKVILDQSADRFFDSGKPEWIIQLAQLQLEEDDQPAYVYGYDDEDNEYYQEYKIHTLSLNSWLEVNRLNSDKTAKQMLYLSGYIEDDQNGTVSLDYYKGAFYFEDYRDTISFDNIYKMSISSGKKHADLLFDYFMNDYIRRNLPAGAGTRKEMHYDGKFHSINSRLIERFDVIN